MASNGRDGGGTREARVLLVDGLAGAYRFFHAIRGLSARDGTPTNAVFGFARMMRQLVRDWQPTHWCVVFDGGIPPERLALVPGYKANRPPMPDALRSQLPLLDTYLAAAGIPSVRLVPFEADDVMATLAVRAAGDGARVRIATSDKDMFQLVNDRVGIVPMAGDAAEMNRDGVHARTGVFPEQVPDWLALTGDSADNIRGVPGVGAITAARLLAGGGCLRTLLDGDAAGVGNPRLRQALLENRSVIERNIRMVTLDRDIVGVPDWMNLRRENAPARPLLDFFRRYNLDSLARDLEAPELF